MADYIKRSDVINAIESLPTWWADDGGFYGGAKPPMVALLDPEDTISAIDNIPSADVAPVKLGRWKNQIQCSECGWYFEDDVLIEPILVFFNYCPNCGARMDGGT